jgi:hypothetical protein
VEIVITENSIVHSVLVRLARIAAVRPSRGLPTNKEFFLFNTTRFISRSHIVIEGHRAVRGENVQLRPVIQGVGHGIGHGMLRELLFRFYVA